jgi:hypothetical protein
MRRIDDGGGQKLGQSWIIGPVSTYCELTPIQRAQDGQKAIQTHVSAG